MPRKYDRTIRYYASWFDDLLDPAKGFTADDCWRVMLAIRDCQLTGSLEPLESLPIEIKRGLSMATMGEQVIRQLERAESMRQRSKKGGDTTASRTPEQIAAAKMRKQLEEQEQLQRDQRLSEQVARAAKPESYLETLVKAAAGDPASLAELRIDIDTAKILAKKKGLL